MTLLIFVTFVAGFYMAWNIGANDVANAMGTSVGSKALTLRRAVFLAAILEFGGAFFVGSPVSETIQNGIVHLPSDSMSYALGMLGALLSTGILLQIASYFGLPLSTTHAIIGSVLGFGLLTQGPSSIEWGKIIEIVASWIISPLLSGIISYGIFSIIQKKILYALNPLEAAHRLAPLFFFLSVFLMSWSLLGGGLIHTHLNLHLSTAITLCCGISLFASFLGARLSRSSFELALSGEGRAQTSVSLEKAFHHLQRVYLSNKDSPIQQKISSVLSGVRELCEETKKKDPFTHSNMHYAGVERIFVTLQIMSACLVAFAHGANDVANAIGPMNAVLSVLIGTTSAIPSWLLAFGGAGIVLGLATWGWRVIETVGTKITELTPTRGFSAEFGAAVTILFASKLGLPISTTHALIGAVFGVGMARGLRALNLKILKEIAISWVVTIPLSAGLSACMTYLLRLWF